MNSLSLSRGISNDRVDVFRLSSLHGEMLVAMFVKYTLRDIPLNELVHSMKSKNKNPHVNN